MTFDRRIFNFAAGPATLPAEVLQQASEEMLNWRGMGCSVMEISHRGPEFVAVAQQTEADLRKLLSIPDDYAVLFTSGGATTTQALLPLNFAAAAQPVDYVVTGHWGKTALKQAKPYAAVNVAATSEADGFRSIPARASWLRALLLERERVANHLGDLGALGNDGGLAFGLAQFSRLKEHLLRATEQALGQRYLLDLVVPGGTRNDLAEALAFAGDGRQVTAASATV